MTAIQGVATIDGVETPVRATSSYTFMQGDQTMIEQSNRDRVSQLTEALAYWIAQDAAGIAARRAARLGRARRPRRRRR